MRKCAILGVLLILFSFSCDKHTERKTVSLYGLLYCDNRSYSELYLGDSLYSFNVDINSRPRAYEIDNQGRLIVEGDTSFLKLRNGVLVSTNDSLQVFRIDTNEQTNIYDECPTCDSLFIRTLYFRKAYCGSDM